MHTHALGRELGNQQEPQRVHDLAHYLHDHHFGLAAGRQPSVNQLVKMIEAIKSGATLPFDDTFLESFNQLTAGYLSGGDAFKEKVILDRLAWAASRDILRELGYVLPDNL